MSRQTSNWVDRGDPVEESLTRVLGGALGFSFDDSLLIEPVQVVRGQGEAAATDGDVAGAVRDQR